MHLHVVNELKHHCVDTQEALTTLDDCPEIAISLRLGELPHHSLSHVRCTPIQVHAVSF